MYNFGNFHLLACNRGKALLVVFDKNLNVLSSDQFIGRERNTSQMNLVVPYQHLVAVNFIMFFLCMFIFLFKFRFVNSSLKLWRRVNMVGFGSVLMDRAASTDMLCHLVSFSRRLGKDHIAYSMVLLRK